VRIRQHTSAYVSIRQHTSAYVSIRQHTSAYVSIRQHTFLQQLSLLASAQRNNLILAEGEEDVMQFVREARYL
jgi:hypothetical protein